MNADMELFENAALQQKNPLVILCLAKERIKDFGFKLAERA